MPVALDRLAANLDAGREDVKGGEGHHAADELLALPPVRLVQFGGSNAMQPDQLLRHYDGVAVDDLRGAGRKTVRRLNVRMATRRPSILLPVRCEISGEA